MNNLINKNKTGWILFILFLVTFAGSIYFIIYNQPESNTGLAIFFYIATLLSLIATIIYGKNNIKTQLAEGYSPANRKKTFWAFIILIIGGVIIDFISKNIGGQKSFTVGLILALIFFGMFFLFFKNKKSS